MSISLGVDTGGTYTDAALLDQKSGRVLAFAKALTTYDDLARGVGQALRGVFKQDQAPPPSSVSLVGLSTTLATNSILEGAGGRASLFLIGYDEKMLAAFDLDRELAATDVVHIGGGHDHRGEEAQALDTPALCQAAWSRRGKVDAIGVSSYFSVKNPAHELAAKEILQRETGLPVTTGHELTTRLDSVKRAATVALNAGLVPVISDLIDKVSAALEEMGVPGRLMVVRGDGSLVSAEWARQRPIETVLSGPAASVVGAWHLARSQDGGRPRRMWVVDMGGTSTDVAWVEDGRPALNLEGAAVGRWRTMVTAVDVRSKGLGGDSLVDLTPEGRLSIGPRRVSPLCRLAAARPQIVAELKAQAKERNPSAKHGLFLVAARPLTRAAAAWERALLERLMAGPISLQAWEAGHRVANRVSPNLEGLFRERLLALAGFTPTDALHAAGDLDLWEPEAARLGAALCARRAGWPADELVALVIDEVSRLAGAEIVAKALADEGAPPHWDREPAGARLLDKALGRAAGGTLGCRFDLSDPVAGIGAPVGAYLPQAVRLLGGEMAWVPQAEVANAVGAVAGGVVIRRKVEIRPHHERPKVVVHLPEEKRMARNLEVGIAMAQGYMQTWLAQACRDAGGGPPAITMQRADLDAPLSPGSKERMLIATELHFTAVGRPEKLGS